MKYFPIDTQPPLLPAKFKAPPVCTALWTKEDWRRYIPKPTQQPGSIKNSLGRWEWTGEVDDKGSKLYRLLSA